MARFIFSQPVGETPGNCIEFYATTPTAEYTGDGFSYDRAMPEFIAKGIGRAIGRMTYDGENILLDGSTMSVNTPFDEVPSYETITAWIGASAYDANTKELFYWTAGILLYLGVIEL